MNPLTKNSQDTSSEYKEDLKKLRDAVESLAKKIEDPPGEMDEKQKDETWSECNCGKLAVDRTELLYEDKYEYYCTCGHAWWDG